MAINTQTVWQRLPVYVLIVLLAACGGGGCWVWRFIRSLQATACFTLNGELFIADFGGGLYRLVVR